MVQYKRGYNMEPMSIEESRRLLAILCLALTVSCFVALLPEIVRFIRLLMVRYRHKKRYIKKVLSESPPPRATFFGRTNGKYTMIEGPYEDQYLSKWKRILWRQNKRNRPQAADKKNKMD